MTPVKESYSISASVSFRSLNSLGEKSTSDVSLILDFNYKYGELSYIELYVCVGNNTCLSLLEVDPKSIVLAAEEVVNTFMGWMYSGKDNISGDYSATKDIATLSSAHSNEV